MSDVVIKAENLSKMYRLGALGGGTLVETAHRVMARIFRRGPQEDAGDLWALKDVSFEIKRGEVFGIVGRNGAGKSTLLKIISRITFPTTGRLEIDGRVGSLLEVGTGFNPELTGRENIYLNGSILGMKRPEIRRKFDEIVEFSGVAKFLDTPVKRYSSGMHTRLAFAVAAHLETDILVVDEVLAVGDAQFQKKCLGKMHEVSDSGRTILFVSHNASAVASLCTRAILVENGTITADGTPSEVLERYANRETELEHVALADRADRSGGGEARVVGLTMQNASGAASGHFLPGEPVDLKVDVRFPERAFGRRVRVSLHLRDKNEYRLFSVYTHLMGKTYQATHEEMSFHCRLPGGFPLLPGLYGIDAAVMLDNHLADKVEWAETVEILPGDYYGGGELPPAVGGPLLVKYDWTVAAPGEGEGCSTSGQAA